MSTVDQHKPLVAALWPSVSTNAVQGIIRKALLVVGGSLLLTISAKISVPFYPVPMTMQTFAVILIGAAFGWRLGAATVLFYLAQGAAGFPVFAGTPEKGIGLAYMAGPTGGYLLGFVAGAIVAGWLAERGWDKSFVRLTVAMFLAHVTIFVFGTAWLGALIGYEKAWMAGVAPFYLATAFKTLLAAACLKAGWLMASPRG
jgi:biotin transport system substrate-specific component